ncbi:MULTISPECIES: hypothetical protein [Nostoc]|uniref:Uncharacterized protein n=1 Tax=Nostoc paludosum FACHB-159 TaxID=2692908 RepID=A0ABR8K1Z9_9NOSO|nr:MULTISPECIES: hypothetical protein [Nostoc]MBD2678326.1 hypothetical protein [Nostoc sp. FACHB-857]MBD2733444.1 hypothetical protein [Nostoc paludosum FACHB-159]
MTQFLRLIINIVVVAAFLLISHQVGAQDWRPVRGGIPFGISGMALIKQQSNSLDFLIVHDNKKPNQSRVAIISLKGNKQPEYFPLNWPNQTELPIDLESLTSVPQNQNLDFICVNSTGKAYYLRLDIIDKNISIIKEFELPVITPKTNLEAFALQYIDGKFVAIWADRGEGETAATVYFGEFNPKIYEIKLSGSSKLKVPFPEGNVRHISDLKVDSSGIVYITSASDAGDDGPFQSAVYVAGYLRLSGNFISWRSHPQFVPLYRSYYHKIEAMELIPGAQGGVIVGTDDENLGSYVYIVGGSD